MTMGFTRFAGSRLASCSRNRIRAPFAATDKTLLSAPRPTTTPRWNSTVAPSASWNEPTTTTEDRLNTSGLARFRLDGPSRIPEEEEGFEENMVAREEEEESSFESTVLELYGLDNRLRLLDEEHSPFRLFLKASVSLLVWRHIRND